MKKKSAYDKKSLVTKNARVRQETMPDNREKSMKDRVRRYRGGEGTSETWAEKCKGQVVTEKKANRPGGDVLCGEKIIRQIPNGVQDGGKKRP